MKTMWSLINGLKTGKSSKEALFVASTTLAAVFAGAGLWLLAGRFFLPGPGWFFCFAGYPGVFIGFFWGIIYLYMHEFG